MNGYPQVALLMKRYKSLGICRKFGYLNALDLLYRQAELIDLENSLQRITEENSKRECAPDLARDWSFLSAPYKDGELEPQWDIMLNIRKKLKEYNDCLVQQVRISTLGPPDLNGLKELRNFIEEEKPFIGPVQGAWHEINEDDLVAVCRNRPKDLLSVWILKALFPIYNKLIGKHFKKPVPEAPDSRICYYSDAHMLTALNTFGIVASSLFPISSIVVLYFISSVLKRLGVIAAFTAIFSLCLALLTEARKVEIFAATSAFAAVQVVFVGSNSVAAA